MGAAPDVASGDGDRVLVQTLRRAGILRHVEPAAASALTRQLLADEFGSGETIFTQGDAGDRVHVIV
ncbi:hypothetical protein ACQV26_06525, partial [Mycobacterium sp. Lab-001]